MGDYGQDLQFGTFLTPDASNPDRVVELALLTEAAGLELATFQDHPYQRRFLDAWALVATVLARTSSLRVTTNVTNLPLRPPHVLATTVASLDLLSRGRVELGLGAGAFWDGIVQMGGPRRTPGEALRALDEGISTVRATWQRGPAPAHDVEIWVGAIGPKMLALTGRVADGWLPSQSYVPPETLGERNQLIDDAAVAAGRAPIDVRRLYNVTPSDDPRWAEWLAELALTHGVSTFVVGTDDPALVQRFGAEVAPAVRELVAAARAGAPVPAAAPTPSQPEVAGMGRHLVDVHDHLRAELAQVFDVIGQVEAGSLDAGRARGVINEMTMRQNDWTMGAYCQSYCRLVATHHTIESSSMFPHLRASDPSLAPVLDRLDEEHHTIHGLLEEVDRALVAVVAGSDSDGLPGLRAAVDRLAEALTGHLSYEEEQLVGPLDRYGFF
ncbi:LLM class flavin-dependent oxidoreductase [Nocardioides sp. CGMCC 1.13656]|uniref:LLM class flavin-dependent oxidoreductase n=1 Tax=Nocardioides TaxID=1839 RepID=UPI0015EB55BA|nr:LLM class flavin-dependent oxidoreductase [Nocardioides sp. CGMCC 1.13656]MBA2956673.1 LLM class flavin-dependent oxidoreductase [Nocardioides sp. CGMCC 1.13656]